MNLIPINKSLVNCVYMTILLSVDATVCDPPCVNGACIGNNICSCYEGWTGDTCNNAEGMLIITVYVI